MNFAEFDEEKFKEEQDQVANQKALLNFAGMAAQGLQDIPSSYEMLHKGKVNRQDIAGQMSRIADGIEDPAAKRSKMAKAYLENRGLLKAKQEDDALAAEKDPNSKESILLRGLAPRWKLDVGPDASAYDIKKLMNPQKMMETEAQSQMEMGNRKALADYQAGIDKRKRLLEHDLDLQTAKAKANINPEKAAFDRLAPEKQKEIETIAGKSAGKKGIINQLRAHMATLKDPKLTEEQKHTAANSIVKVLNSAEGQDAVGEGEATRLMGLLKFNVLNLTNPGPVFGRAPISDFADQVGIKAQELEDGVARNQQEIDRLYGRPLSENMNAGRSMDSGAAPATRRSAPSVIEAMIPKANASNAFPRTVRKGGQTATVSSQAELEEAAAEGWQ